MDSESFGGIYSGPFAVSCAGPGCEPTTLMESGARGPGGWLDLSVWSGESRSAEGLGYFCSFDCLRESIGQWEGHGFDGFRIEA